MKPIFILVYVFTGLISCTNSTLKNDSSSTKKDTTPTVSTEPPASVQDSIIQDGENLEFYQSGKLKFQGMRKNGKRDGLWKSFYENGSKWSETTFSEGKKYGRTTTWYENSQMRYDGYYNNDIESGKWTYWDEQGKLIETKDFDMK